MLENVENPGLMHPTSAGAEVDALTKFCSAQVLCFVTNILCWWLIEQYLELGVPICAD